MDVKELAERLKRITNLPKMDMEGNPSENGFRPGMWITAEEADLLLSALQTVAGIEMLKQFDVLIDCDEYPGDNWTAEIGMDGYAKRFTSTDLHSAVHAAVEAAGKGEK